MRRRKEIRRSLFAFALVLLAQAASAHVEAPKPVPLTADIGSSTRDSRAPAAMVGASPTQAAFSREEMDAINDAIVASHPSVTILGDPTPRYDCHGFTFGAGRGWTQQDRVESILAEQGWILRADGDQQVGDIAIYRKGGVITHSGIVSAVQGGTATRIQSKWGKAGLYEHDPTDVPRGYGQVEILHRSTALAMVLQSSSGPAAFESLSIRQVG
ncbi:DUF7689 domain-containing protein [Rhodospirillaceae bacterium SYSU D60014]|uniref:DUF7689 domain-containing protein n=1 Tax=Virgifigura deserti TaxID=2268457 RepID=UPI0013C4EC71